MGYIGRLVTMYQIPCESEDIQAILIPKSITMHQKDMIIVNIYDSPDESSYKKRKRASGKFVSTIDQLLDFLAIQKDSDILL